MKTKRPKDMKYSREEFTTLLGNTTTEFELPGTDYVLKVHNCTSAKAFLNVTIEEK